MKSGAYALLRGSHLLRLARRLLLVRRRDIRSRRLPRRRAFGCAIPPGAGCASSSASTSSVAAAVLLLSEPLARLIRNLLNEHIDAALLHLLRHAKCRQQLQYPQIVWMCRLAAGDHRRGPDQLGRFREKRAVREERVRVVEIVLLAQAREEAQQSISYDVSSTWNL